MTKKTKHELNVLVAKKCHMMWEGRKLYIKESGGRRGWCIRYGPSNSFCWRFNPAGSIVDAMKLALHHMPKGWRIDLQLRSPEHKIVLKRSPMHQKHTGWEKWRPINTLEEMARIITEAWLEAMEMATKIRS